MFPEVACLDVVGGSRVSTGKKVSRDERSKVPAVTRFWWTTRSEILSSKQVLVLRCAAWWLPTVVRTGAGQETGTSGLCVGGD